MAVGGDGAQAIGTLEIAVKRWILLVLCSTLCGPVYAQTSEDAIVSAQAKFFRGNDQYRSGRYAEAIESFRAVLHHGVENGVVYYNLGNALLKNGKIGEAVWAYLKAQALLPHDSDVAANLAYAQSLVSSAQEVSVRPSHLVRWAMLGRRQSAWELAAILAWLLWLAAIGWALVGWLERVRRVVAPVAWVTTVTAIAVGCALAVQTHWDATPKAVTVREHVDVKFAPQSDGTTHFSLPEGAVVYLQQQTADWMQIRRHDGRSGWIERAAVLPL